MDVTINCRENIQKAWLKCKVHIFCNQNFSEFQIRANRFTTYIQSYKLFLEVYNVYIIIASVRILVINNKLVELIINRNYIVLF